jgi:uncharacterized Zn finger protein (UPF0148 family)
MSLFEDVGRKVEEFKQQAQNAADDPSHGCRNCKTALYSDYGTCPNCGSDEVVALSDDDGGPSDDDGTDSREADGTDSDDADGADSDETDGTDEATSDPTDGTDSETPDN